MGIKRNSELAVRISGAQDKDLLPFDIVMPRGSNLDCFYSGMRHAWKCELKYLLRLKRLGYFKRHLALVVEERIAALKAELKGIKDLEREARN